MSRLTQAVTTLLLLQALAAFPPSLLADPLVL